MKSVIKFLTVVWLLGAFSSVNASEKLSAHSKMQVDSVKMDLWYQGISPIKVVRPAVKNVPASKKIVSLPEELIRPLRKWSRAIN